VTLACIDIDIFKILYYLVYLLFNTNYKTHYSQILNQNRTVIVMFCDNYFSEKSTKYSDIQSYNNLGTKDVDLNN
jgi:hypothetical protein